MSGVIVLNQPSVEVVNADGYTAVARISSSIPNPVSGVLVAGSNGGTARLLQVAADGTLRIDPSGTTTQPISGSVTANIGTTGGLALDATLAKLTVAQSAPLGANTLALIGGSVTTSSPSYTSGNVNPLSLTTSGALRVDGSAVTQPVSGTVTANAGTGPWPVTDNSGSLTVDTTQLPASLVGGRLDINTGAWLGSTAPTVGQKVMASALPVTMASDQPPIAVAQTSATATTSSVAANTSSVTLLSLNTSRRGATIYNDSNRILYVKLGSTASVSDYTVQLGADAYYELPFGYTGRVDGIWTSGSGGTAIITELV